MFTWKNNYWKKPRCTSCTNRLNIGEIFPFVIEENTIMRNEMETVIKEKFRILALKTRYERGFTQNEMSRLLVMSERSYEDLESGRSGCSALTTILLLMEVDNPIDFLNDLRKQLKEAYEIAGESV